MKTLKTYYLNNTGHRWVNIESESGRREMRNFKTTSGKTVQRRVIFYEAFGNFAVACISYKGKRIKVLLDQVLED